MKKKAWISVICFLFHLSAQGTFTYPQKDESMARVQRLLMASIIELPAEQWLADINATGSQDVPAYIKFLGGDDIPYDNYTYHILMPFICKIDGSNIRSTGDDDLLRLARDFLAVKSEKPDWQSAAHCLLYLSQKGDSKDLVRLEKYSIIPDNNSYAKQAAVDSLHILQSRVAGTNVLTGLRTQYYCWSTNEPPFLPSVVNTGPQAAYVYDLLKQALAKYGTATNIPAALLTMRVWFGADGKPVCNVDLAQYGLVMPDFTAAFSPADTHVPATAAATQEPAAVAEKADIPSAEPAVEPPPQTRLIVPFAVGVGVLAVLALLLAHFRRRR